MKSQYTAPKLLSYGDVDALTQFLGKAPTDDSFTFNGILQDSDGSTPFNINT
ncbi:MAG: lasso peptide [Thermosynechococcaceae cyanobacterium MS004]|nr:lasso peptide [Thermosynechococcaceae cyanobacterium MS004]